MKIDFAIQALEVQRDEAAAEVARLQVELKELRSKVKQLDHAISVLAGSDTSAKQLPNRAKTLKELIVEALTANPKGMTPMEIAAWITNNSDTEGNNTSVSSTISRDKGETFLKDDLTQRFSLKSLTLSEQSERDGDDSSMMHHSESGLQPASDVTNDLQNIYETNNGH